MIKAGAPVTSPYKYQLCALALCGIVSLCSAKSLAETLHIPSFDIRLAAGNTSTDLSRSSVSLKVSCWKPAMFKLPAGSLEACTPDQAPAISKISDSLYRVTGAEVTYKSVFKRGIRLDFEVYIDNARVFSTSTSESGTANFTVEKQTKRLLEQFSQVFYVTTVPKTDLIRLKATFNGDNVPLKRSNAGYAISSVSMYWSIVTNESESQRYDVDYPRPNYLEFSASKLLEGSSETFALPPIPARTFVSIGRPPIAVSLEFTVEALTIHPQVSTIGMARTLIFRNLDNINVAASLDGSELPLSK